MRTRTLIALTLLMFMVGLHHARAQDTKQYENLSLEDCVKIALENYGDVLVAGNSLISGKARVTQALSGYFPQITVQRSETHQDSDLNASGTSNSGTLRITQNIYDGGLREAKVRSAHAGALQSEYGLERTRQTTVYNITRDYFALLRSLRLADVKDAQVKYLEEQQAMIKTRVELGDAAEVDALPVEAQLANAVVDQLSARNNVQTAAVQLQNDMGLAPQENFSVLDYSAPEAAINPLDHYLNLALSARPEIFQAQAGVTSALSSVKSARISLMPRPVISGEYDRSLVNDDRYTFTITGGLFFDLFDGGSNRAAYRDAKAGLSSAQIRAKQTERDISAQVRQAYLNLVNSRERMAASDLSQTAAQKNYDAQQSRYKQGLAIPLDLLNAQVALVNARSGSVQARYDYYTALAQLEYAVGGQGGIYEK